MHNIDEVNNSNNSSDEVNDNDIIVAQPIYPSLLAYFIDYYPEFKPLADSEISSNFKTILNVFKKVRCLFNEYEDLNDSNIVECKLTPFFLLVAHYIIIEGNGLDLVGMQKPTGLVSSASVGSVSTSFQTAPYKDNFEYFYNQTTYGQQYLAFLSRKSGIRYVN